jgi:hypothetical protein
MIVRTPADWIGQASTGRPELVPPESALALPHHADGPYLMCFFQVRGWARRLFGRSALTNVLEPQPG